MIKKTITVGRKSDNNKVFDLPDISGQHARIHLLENGMFKIEDLSSTNGTYVNGYRIKTATVSADDQVRLSAGLIIDLPVLFGIKQGPVIKNGQENEKAKANPLDFTEEFAKLESVYNNYKEGKKKILVANQRKQVVTRMAFMATPLLIQYFTGKIAISGASILLASAAQLVTGNMKHLDKIEELDNDFKIRYVCPNHACSQSLSYNSWTVWHITGQCPRCKAIFNKDKL